MGIWRLRLWRRPCSDSYSSLGFFFLRWKMHDYSAIHQPAPCLTESIQRTAAPSCPLSARFPDWSVVSTGCQTPYPQLHHSEWAELPRVSQENLAGELFSPCCPPLPLTISSPFSHYKLNGIENWWYPSNYWSVSVYKKKTLMKQPSPFLCARRQRDSRACRGCRAASVLSYFAQKWRLVIS